MLIIRNTGLFAKKIKENWFILKEKDTEVQELNEIAGYIWEMAEKPVDTDIIITKLTKIYDADLKIIETDVNNFVEKFLKEGYVKRLHYKSS